MDKKQVIIDDLNEDDESFTDNSRNIENEQQDSNYFALRNTGGQFPMLKKMLLFFQSDVKDFLDSNIEADNYIPEDYDSDQEMDNFGSF